MKTRSVLRCGDDALLADRAQGLTQYAGVRRRLRADVGRCAAVFGLFVSALCLCAGAQTNYTVDCYSVDSGGSTSTGGVYSVSGSAGQPEAGALSGGDFTLAGGFWSVVAGVQTPGAPYLKIAWTNNAVTVSWTKSAVGWSLESSTALGTNTWTQIPPPYATNATDCFVTEPSPPGNRFYRLRKP